MTVYDGMVTTTDVLEREQLAVELLDQANISVLPFIAILKHVDLSHFTVKFSDYAKILLAAGFTKRISGFWVVGAPAALKDSMLAAVSRFYGPKFYFVDTTQEALAQARKLIGETKPLLE